MLNICKKISSLVIVVAVLFSLIPEKTIWAEDLKKATIALQNAKSPEESAEAFYTDALNDMFDLKFYGIPDYQLTGLGWVSSNTRVATVDQMGMVTTHDYGTATISYHARGYETASVEVIVGNDALQEYLTNGLHLDVPQMAANGSTAEVGAISRAEVHVADQITKENCDQYNFSDIGESKDFCFMGAKGYSASTHAVAWSSSDTAVATVDSKGVVTTVGEGQAEITATIVDRATGQVAFKSLPMYINVSNYIPVCTINTIRKDYLNITLPSSVDVQDVRIEILPYKEITSLVANSDSNQLYIYTSDCFDRDTQYNVYIYKNSTEELVSHGEFTFIEPLIQAKVVGPLEISSKGQLIENMVFREHETLERYIRIFYKLPDEPVANDYRYIPMSALMCGYDIKEWDRDASPFFLKIQNPEVADIESGSGLLDIRGNGTSAVEVLYDDAGKIVVLGTFNIRVGNPGRLFATTYVVFQGGYKLQPSNLYILSRELFPGYNRGVLTYQFKDQYTNALAPESVDVTVTCNGKDASDMFSTIEANLDGEVLFVANAEYFEEHADVAQPEISATITAYGGGGKITTTKRIYISNVDYLNGLDSFAEKYVVRWPEDNPSQLGLIGNEERSELYLSAQAVHTINNVPCETYPIDGDYDTIKGLQGDDLSPYEGQCFVNVTLTVGKNTFQGTEYDQNSGEPMEIGSYGYNDDHDTIFVLVREPFLQIGNGDPMTSARNIQSLSTVQVSVTFYMVVLEEDGYHIRKMCTSSRQLHSKDHSNIKKEWTYYNTTGDEFYGDPLEWVEQNCELTVIAGDQKFVVDKNHSFADNGIIAEVQVPETDPYRISTVHVYVPVGEGYSYTFFNINKRMAPRTTNQE